MSGVLCVLCRSAMLAWVGRHKRDTQLYFSTPLEHPQPRKAQAFITRPPLHRQGRACRIGRQDRAPRQPGTTLTRSPMLHRPSIRHGPAITGSHSNASKPLVSAIRSGRKGIYPKMPVNFRVNALVCIQAGRGCGHCRPFIIGTCRQKRSAALCARGQEKFSLSLPTRRHHCLRPTADN